jgi:hypothetical protein
MQLRAARGDGMLAQVMDMGFSEIVPEAGEVLSDLAADLRAAAGRKGVVIQFNESHPGRLIVQYITAHEVKRHPTMHPTAGERTVAQAPPLPTAAVEDWHVSFLHRLGTAISLAAVCVAVGVTPEIAQAERASDAEFARVWDRVVAQRRKPLADADQARLLAALVRTGIEWAACAEIGIRHRTLSSWQAQDPVFAAAKEATLRHVRAGNAALLGPAEERRRAMLTSRQLRAARGDGMLAQVMDTGLSEIVPEAGEDIRDLAADLRAAAGRRGVFIQFNKALPGRLMVRCITMPSSD